MKNKSEKPVDDKEESAKIYVGYYCYITNVDQHIYVCQVLLEGELKDFEENVGNRDYEGVGRKLGEILLSRGIYKYEIYNGKKLKIEDRQLVNVPIGTISCQQVSDLERGINEELGTD